MSGYKVILLMIAGLVLIGCDRHNGDQVSGVDIPSAESARPLPEVGPMIERLVRQDGAKDFTAEMRMIATDGTGRREQIDFRVQRKHTDDQTLTFFAVLSPLEETDKAFLAIESDNQPTQASSYLSGLRKVARLNSGRSLGFRGARVTVQEMLGMELDKYTPGKVERVTEDSEQLIRAELEARPDSYLAFPAIIVFFREADQHPVKFELLNEGRKLQKIVMIKQVEKIQNHLTITKVEIDDLAQQLKLVLETRKVSYDSGLSDRIFTEDHLKSFIDSASRRLDQN